MDISDTVLSVIELAGEDATERIIQSYCYFLDMTKVATIDFHHNVVYPFSSEVHQTISTLHGLGFIKESEYDGASIEDRENFIGKRNYKVTKDGMKILDKIKNANATEHEKVKQVFDICWKFSKNLPSLVNAACMCMALKEGIN